MKNSQIVWGIRILVAAVFVLSAVAKLHPNPVLAITNFENSYLNKAIGLDLGTSFSKIVSRFLIGLEFTLAILILLPFYLKKIVFPSIITLLSLFSVHLAIQAISGDASNCGCFGELIPMSPLQALIKNILTIGLLILPITLYKDELKDKMNLNPVVIIGLSISLLMFVFIPFNSIFNEKLIEKNKKLKDDAENLKNTIDELIANEMLTKEGSIKLDSVFKYNELTKKNPVDTSLYKPSEYTKYFKDIDKGNKLLCFFSPTCEHCMETGKEITELKNKYPGIIPDIDHIKIIFMDETQDGSESQIQEYFNFIGAKYEYQVLPDDLFVSLFWGEKDFPGVLYMYNGVERIFFDGISENEFDSDKLIDEIVREY